ncbi:MAG: BON domain-containing protein [Gemmatimonadaceae bacterium]|nr:BON domain-containing protein [Gemmatimonadaceae bacterium]
MARIRTSSGRTRPRTEAALLLALGAIGGVLLGVAIADRLGGLDGLRGRLGSRKARRHRPDGWRGDERRSQSFETLADDDSELAPEAIAHLHLHGRHPTPAGSVTTPTTTTADYDEIERRVLEAFRNDPILARRVIDISADDAGVTLTGWVRDAKEQRYATVLARGVPGVGLVRSELAVVPITFQG